MVVHRFKKLKTLEEIVLLCQINRETGFEFISLLTSILYGKTAQLLYAKYRL